MPRPGDELLEELSLSPGESAFAKDSQTANTGEMNRSRIIADLYLAHRLRGMVDDSITTSRELASSNDRNAGAMRWLTEGLIFVGLVQAAFVALQAFSS